MNMPTYFILTTNNVNILPESKVCAEGEVEIKSGAAGERRLLNINTNHRLQQPGGLALVSFPPILNNTTTW